ncbi:MAG: aldehyde dehydrogenase (NADP(+)) [Verrucomicrobia bacterium]|nr:MAG: aldehyde dehydrogenase (NADP(+)) [Verrucomicrobiota bacterium]
MELHGHNIIAGKLASSGQSTFSAVDPTTAQRLPPVFCEASAAEIDHALHHAVSAFADYRAKPPDQIAAFLEQIAQEILALGDTLIQRAQAETALPAARLTSERGRTVNQLKMFADLVREGSWIDAVIDHGNPQRQPLPKPDVRRMLIPVGPVIVFAASNFPLAFSVAGGDTASALAAGNPVIVKAHPAHPGTSELVATAVVKAADATEMPAGVFSHLHGTSHEVGRRLVQHSATKAVAFTGSLRAGRALCDLAAARPQPIPVYAEMGSTNPVFLLPGALAERASALAEGLFQSVTLGVGQFCTNPGVVFAQPGPTFDAFSENLARFVGASAPGTMLYPALCDRFNEALDKATQLPGVSLLRNSKNVLATGETSAAVLRTNFTIFQKHTALQEEIFGPATILVSCDSLEAMLTVARSLPGQLTATIHGTEADLLSHRPLVEALEQKAGRLIFNGFPTGVEVCPAMHHGGPYPATSNPLFTSVGTAAIRRFARPVCFQNFPQSALPPELRDDNPRHLWRLVDGQWTHQ